MKNSGLRLVKLFAGVAGITLVGYGIATGYFDLRPDHLVYSYGGRLRMPWPLLLTFFLGYLIGSSVLGASPEPVASGDTGAGVMESFSQSDDSSRSYSQLMVGITAGIIVSAGCIALSVLVQR